MLSHPWALTAASGSAAKKDSYEKQQPLLLTKFSYMFPGRCTQFYIPTPGLSLTRTSHLNSFSYEGTTATTFPPSFQWPSGSYAHCGPISHYMVGEQSFQAVWNVYCPHRCRPVYMYTHTHKHTPARLYITKSYTLTIMRGEFTQER